VVAIDGAGNRSTPVTISTTTSIQTPVVYPENGYLMMPPNQFTWGGITGQADANYIKVAGSPALSTLFDQSLPSPVTFDSLPFVTYVTNVTTNPYENISIGTGSLVGKIALQLSTSRGADATTLNTYLQNTTKVLGVKLSVGYKTLNITSNISTVTTRTSGVNASFEYAKCVLNDGIGDYIPTSISTNKFFCSDGSYVLESNGYVYSATKKTIRVNADGTLELLLPKGTLSSIDIAGISDYLAKTNLKIYYV
jgi:hypothetical protein